MNANSDRHIFVIANYKGGVGKTTCAMHLISYLLSLGIKVLSIDLDFSQGSLSSYVENRKKYNNKNPKYKVPETTHFGVKDFEGLNEQELKEKIDNIINNTDTNCVVIDTPGSFSASSSYAYSKADTIITPINDSFVDIDLLAKVDPSDLSVISPGPYSEVIWKQKLAKAQQNAKQLEWFVVRNRISPIEVKNKQNVSKVLSELSKRISFKLIEGFKERVIFKELFLNGLTLIDFDNVNYKKAFTVSNIAARQELRSFMSSIGIKKIFPQYTKK